MALSRENGGNGKRGASSFEDKLILVVVSVRIK
jgi:hypothetical protein